MAARRWLPIVLGAVLLYAAIAGIAQLDTYHPTLREVVVPVRGLTREVAVLQASDLHADQFGDKQSELAELLRGHRIDAAVMTGDMLDFGGEDKKPALDLADVLRAATGRVYFVPGNHDPDDMAAALVTRGVKPLHLGAPMPLTSADPDAAATAIIYGRTSASIAAAEGVKQLVVIASHTPPNTTRLGAGKMLHAPHLYIAGHTHAGQVRIPIIGAIWAPTSWGGEEGGTSRDNEFRLFPDLRGYMIDGMYERDGEQVYVSPGLGCTLFPWRVFDRSALVLYRFVPE